MRQTTYYIRPWLLIGCLLSQLVNCNQCKKNNSKGPASSTSNVGSTSNTNNNSSTPVPSPITDAMIQEVIDKKDAQPSAGWELLEEVLKDLKNGNNTTINKQDIDKWTALHYAAHLGNPNIVKALLNRNADINLRNSYSYTPFHVAISEKHFNAVLLLLNSNKISKANLEAAVMMGSGTGKITALAYVDAKAKKGDANQANWQAIISAIKAAGATK